jgi:hypothetical protein
MRRYKVYFVDVYQYEDMASDVQSMIIEVESKDDVYTQFFLETNGYSLEIRHVEELWW